ncbi:MAG: hypothetical protein CSA62_09065 [Planctomycetota bacterium]|nr:MAG: hypothetical protein CSA62_09065 [Planctomycetota bacterium]
MLAFGLWAALLLFLPLFPSQDGPTHLLTGSLIFDLWQGEAPATEFYSWRSLQLTNQLCNITLGALLSLGLSVRVAEAVFHLLLLALLVAAWRPLLRRVGASPWALALVLLPFMGRVLHMGFYNFLLSVHLGLLAWTLRRPGPRNLRSDALFLMCLYAHPLGAASFLGLAGFERLLGLRRRQGWREILWLLPHALLLASIWSGNASGGMASYLTEWPDFFGATWIAYRDLPVPGPALLALRVALVLGLVVGVVLGWRTLGVSSKRCRVFLLLAATPALLGSGLFPDSVGEGDNVRIRAAYFCWILLLPALAPPLLSASLRWLEQVVLLLAITLFLTQAVADHRLATEQSQFLEQLPRPAAGQTLLMGHDVYNPPEQLGHLGLQALEPYPERGGALIAPARRPYFRPWLHLLDRWALEHELLSLMNHQAFYTHSPILHQQSPGHLARMAVEYCCSQVPLEPLAGAADLLLFANLPSGWLERERGRVPSSLLVKDSGSDWVLFAAAEAASAKKRLEAGFYHGKMPAMPVPPWPVTKAPASPRIEVLPKLRSSYAGRYFRAYLVDSKAKSFRSVKKTEFAPASGRFDAKGGTRVDRCELPPGHIFLLVPY